MNSAENRNCGSKSKLKMAFEKVDPGDMMGTEWIQYFQKKLKWKTSEFTSQLQKLNYI